MNNLHTTQALRCKLLVTATLAGSLLLAGCGGTSSPSGTGDLAKQTITFNPPATEPYGVAPLTLSAIASSGLPVTISLSSGPATLSGSILTIKGIGSITLVASQAGNASYAAATASAIISVTNPNPQPVPTSSPGTTMTVTSVYEGYLSPTMIGPKIGKSTVKKGYFATNGVVNQTTLQFYQTLGPNGGTIGMGQGTEDNLSWNPTGTGEISNELTSTDTMNMAAFMKAIGPTWKLIWGINLGGMAPTGYTPPLYGNQFPTSPTQAAQEVISLVQALGPNWNQYLAGIEIGNEPDLDQWHENHHYCAAQNVTNYTSTCGESGPNGATSPPWTESGVAPYGFEQTWEELHTAIVNAMTAGGYGTMPFIGPDTTNIYTTASTTQPAINNPTAWTADFGADKGSELAMLTSHYYPFSPTSTVQTLMQAGGIDPIMIGPNTSSINPTQPTNGIANLMYTASATTTPAHTWGFDEINSIGGGGTHLVSDSYASALWGVDVLLSIAQGYSNGKPSGGQGGTLALFNTGGFGCTGTSVSTSVCPPDDSAPGNYYTPVYDSAPNNVNDTIHGVLPLFYGMMFVSRHVGSGNLYYTTLSTGGRNVTGYSVFNPATGALNLIVLNKDISNTAINMTATLPSTFSIGQIMVLTQSTNGATLPNLSATPLYPGEDVGITIQGQSVNNVTGAYTPGSPYYAAPSGNTISFYVPPLSAVLVQLQP